MQDPANRKAIITGMVSNTRAGVADFRSVGGSGLAHSSGYIFEDTDAKLRGQSGAKIYKHMGESDPSCATILHLINQIVAGVKWYVEPATPMPEDKEAADFLDSCLNDLETPFSDTVIENMSMVQYGYSVHEIIYKRRCGNAEERWMRSKHSDGRIGWRGLPIRGQDTISRWGFADDGTLEYVEQQPPPSYQMVQIPMEKLLLFRSGSHKNSPEGVSMLRRCYQPWWRMQAVEQMEGVGIERDLTGIPVAEVPLQIMSSDATDSEKALFQAFQDIVSRTKRDEQEGMVLPSDVDENGNKMFTFKLLTTGGSRQFDTTKIIERYQGQIFRAALASFLTLGQSGSSSGSYALHSSAASLFLDSLKAQLHQIKNVYNLHAVKRLFALNTFQVTELPKLEHTPLDAVDVKDLSAAILALTQAGMPLFPNDEATGRIMEILGLPKPADPDRIARQAMAPTMATNDGKPVKEIPEGATDDEAATAIKPGPDSVADIKR